MGTNATPLVEVDTFPAGVYPPEAGTPVLAADVIVGEQVLADRTLYLKNRLGTYILETPQINARGIQTDTPYYTNATAGYTDTGVMFGVGVGTVLENDLIEVSVTATALINTGSNRGLFRVTYKNASASYVQMPGMYAIVTETAVTATFTLSYFLQWTAATVASPALFQLEAKADVAVGTGVQLIADNSVSLKRWRLLL